MFWGRLLGVIAVLLAGAWGLFELVTERTTEERLATAQALYGSGDYEAAIVELKNVLLEQSDHADAQWLIVQSYLGLRNGPEALLEIARLKEIGSKGPEITSAELRAMLLDGQYEEVLSRLLFARPAARDPSMFLLRGEARMGLRRYDSARDAFLEAVRIQPENVEARRGLAAAALAMGDFPEAEKLLAAAPEDCASWLLRGRLRLALGDASGAAAAFAKARATAGDALDEKLALAWAALAAHQQSETAVRLAEAIAIHPKDLGVHDLIETMAKHPDDLAAAETALRQILDLAPGHPNALLLMALVKHDQGDLKLAEANLSSYVGRRSGDRSATKLLAQIYLTQRRPRVAIELLAPMVQPTAPDPELLTMLGGAYLRIEDYAKAAQVLGTAVAVAPDAAVTRPLPGTIALVSGQADNAAEAFADAIGVGIDHRRADRLLAIARFGSGEYEAMVETATALLRNQSDNPLPHNLLAAVEERRGDVEKARGLYQKALAVDAGDVTALYNLARLSWKTGAVAAARERLERVLSREPDSVPVLSALSRIACAENRLEDAVSLLQRARAADPEDLNANLALTEVYARQGRAIEALRVAEEAAGLAANDPGALMALGRAQLAAERPAEALVTLRKLTTLAPDSADAHFEFAQASLEANHDTSARLALAKVLELDPEHLQGKVALGTLALREGNIDKAMELAQRIKETHPELASGHALQGDVHLAQRKPREAVGAYEAALQQAPDTSLVLKLVDAHARAGNPGAAHDTLNRWLREHPDDVEARVARAQGYLKNGNTRAAIKDLETALKLRPDHARALNELAWLYYRKGDPRALEMAEHAHTLVPDRPEVLDAYGWLLVENDHVARGMTLLKKALSKSPDDPQIRYHLVGALARDGQRERAREELETLLRSDQDFLDRDAARRLLEDLR